MSGKNRSILLILVVLAWSFIAGGAMAAELEVTSPAFEDRGMIPAEYSCKGADVSPEINWSGAPDGTKSFALVCEDPDAPAKTWIHWVVFNIPASVSGLAANSSGNIPGGGIEGVNSWGRNDYGGPCPPSGAHRYYFKIYALDEMLNLPGKTTSLSLKRAMKGHILAEGQLMGKFRK